MFNEFLNNYKKRIKVPFYNENGEVDETELLVKPLSINDLMYIVDDEKCGHLLIKIIDGIDIKENVENVKEVIQRAIINPDYVRLFYSVVACCVFVKNEDGKMFNLKNNIEMVEFIPIEIQIEILNYILELSIPVDLNKFSNNVKKLQARMTKN